MTQPPLSHETPIHRVAVIGAGVMGAAIAAHVANAGVPVLLLDVTRTHAEAAISRLMTADPAPLMLPDLARLITPGGIDEDLGTLVACDWIIEAVVERLEVKRDLYHRLEAVKAPGVPLSSNTSTFPLAELCDGMSPALRRNFLITHFFNPPRYMRLMELVTGPDTDTAVARRVTDFADRKLGKTVIPANDTPGFIANRIGAFWLQTAINRTMEFGLTVAEADAVLGRPFGVPKTGVFGLLDLVGLDLMAPVAASLLTRLGLEDPYRAAHRDHPVIARLIADGYTGRKGKGGFYRLNREQGEKRKEMVDLASGTFAPMEKPQLECLESAGRNLKALVSYPDRGGRCARTVLLDVLGYAAALVPEIADSTQAVDTAMRLGYAWNQGPFELIDSLGAGWLIDALQADHRMVPPLLIRAAEAGGFYRVLDGTLQALHGDGRYHDIRRPDGVLPLADIKRRGKPVIANAGASLWDIGDGVACLEFHTKMNSIDGDVLALIRESLTVVGEDYRALVIHNDGPLFSAGANIGLTLFAANIAAWDEIDRLVTEGQATYQAIRNAPFPVVGAPSGFALGGGCEILLHCDAVQAHGELYMGLVEAGVGVIPAWGGCTEMLRRWQAEPKLPQGPMPAVAKVFETISTARVAKSAEEARALHYLSPLDGITMNRDRVLFEAKARALAMANGDGTAGYRPPPPADFHLPGPSGAVALGLAVDGAARLGKATPHDVTVCRELARVLTGGDHDVTDTIPLAAMLRAERTAFMALIHTAPTLARVEAMLETGKPLRN